MLYVLPPGGGKTILFSSICAGAVSLGKRVLILCHRAELIDQVSRAIEDQGVQHGYISAQYEYERGLPVYIASVFTLAKRLALFTPDLVVIDEAHHVTPTTTWGRILEHYPKALRLGVTASPIRLSGQGLDSFFEAMVEGPTYETLIAEGFLTPVKVYAPPTIDTQGLHTRLGDYAQGEVAERATKPSVTGDAIEHYRRLTPGKRAVVFDVSIAAARARADSFRAAGFTADCIDGSLDPQLRRRLVSDFRAGRLQVLTSCELISEGFDLPAIEVGISLRPTQSIGLYLQQTGRILRPFEGKSVSYLFDHAGNVHRFGLPTQSRSWSLSGLAESTHGAKPVASVRVCPQCFCAQSNRVLVCVQCGHRFESRPRAVVEREGELEEITLTADQLAARRKRAEQGKARSLESLIEIGRMRRMRNPVGWATHVFNARKAKGRA